MSPLLPRVTAAQIGPNAMVDLYIWLGFQFVADQFLLPILLLTFFFAKSVKRHFTLVNFVFTWIIAGVVSSLLFYNQTQIGPQPSQTLCVLQAATLEAVPPMTSIAVFLVIFSVWRGIRSRSPGESHRSSAMFYISVILPYIAWIAFSVAGILIGAADPSRVSRDRRFFYCSIDMNYYSNTQSIFTAVIIVLALAMEVHIACVLCRNWRALSKLGNVAGMDVSTIIRVLLFGIYLLCSLLASLSSVLDEQSVVPDMFSATIGMAVFLIFGLQRDVLRAWCFWLPTRSRSQLRDSAALTFSTNGSTVGSSASGTSTKVDDREAYPAYSYGAKKEYGQAEQYAYNPSNGGAFLANNNAAIGADLEPFPYKGPRSYSPQSQPQPRMDMEKASVSDVGSHSDASIYSSMTERPLAPQLHQQGVSMMPSPYSPPRPTVPLPPVAALNTNHARNPSYGQTRSAGGAGRHPGQPRRQESVDSQTNSSIYSQSTGMHPPPPRPYRPGNLDLGNIYENERR